MEPKPSDFSDPDFQKWKRENLTAAALQTKYPDTFFPGGFTARDEANAIVAYAFRNGPIEQLHAGKHSPLLDDPGLSRITDAEMKELMLCACEKMEELLRLRDSDPDAYLDRLKVIGFRFCQRWQR